MGQLGFILGTYYLLVLYIIQACIFEKVFMKTFLSVTPLVGGLVDRASFEPEHTSLGGRGAGAVPLLSPRSPGLCVCVRGELMRTEWLSLPGFPNPICSNKKLKGKERGDPAGQGGRNNNPYPWATFEHMQPFHTVLRLLLRQRGVGPMRAPLFLKHY